ncbi:MAG: glycosyl hydrolase [bacterium]
MFGQNLPRCILAAVWALALAAPGARAMEPADPDLIPEARKLLEYVVSGRDGKILTGISRFGGGPHAVLHKTGREPAISGTDIYGFHRKFGEQYHRVVRSVVAHCKHWWHEQGGIVALHCHWGLPGDPEGTAWGDKRRKPVRIDLAKAVTPGTEEHRNVINDLSVTADYLEQLAEARVPVLWRPLHEIDGGWFWWTDKETPENTAKLWRLVFHYLVKERGVHNLIWVYNAAHVAGALRRQDATFDDHVAYRKRFYPGTEYVDIASIDTYPNPRLGWGKSWEDARRRAYELMQQVAPGKPLAIGEDHVLLDPDVAQREGPAWVYCLAWFSSCKKPGWMRHSFNHEHMLTLDELPRLHDRNVMPNACIEKPADGAALAGTTVQLEGLAGDRNANLVTVRIHALRGPWRNWFLRGDDQAAGLFPASTRLGEAEVKPDGRWTFTWEGAPAGFHNLVAFAEDAEGAVACSNAVRVTAGIENLACDKSATASSTSKWGGPPEAAVDGDPTTMWWSDKAQPDPQWLMVDLGSDQTVGAVAVSWWKPYARDYTVQVSADGQRWREVARVEGKRNFHGDSDILRFEPVQARYLRLHCTERAVTWQAYTVFEFGVYESLPRPPATKEPRP